MDRIIDSLFDFIKEEGAVVRSITNGFSSSQNVDACFQDMQGRALRVYRHLLLEQGVPERKATLAAYALMEMINSTITEFAHKSNEEDREMLKEMVRGALRVLIHGKSIKPHVPAHILEPEQKA